jgi:hypothetical protein
MANVDVIPPTVKTLSELEGEIRTAHAGVIGAHTSVVSGLSSMVEKAIEAGTHLVAVEDRKLVPHGQKILHYKRCHLGERQAERYKKLARLVAANPTCKSDLAGLSIDAAIKRALSSFKHRQQPTGKKSTRSPKTSNQPASVRTTHTDIIDAWMQAPASERQRAVSSIGLELILAAMPEDWWPLIDERRARPPAIAFAPPSSLLDQGLDIPTFLQRTPVNGGRQ